MMLNGSRMSEKDSRGTRRRVLDVSRDLISRQGYAGTSIADIAKRLGTSKAAIYHYFGSKEELLEALLAEPLLVYARIAERAAQGAPAAELLAAVIELTAASGNLAGFDNDPSTMRVLEERARRPDVLENSERIIEALAGSDASPQAQIRARAAFTVAKEGTAAAAAACGGAGLSVADRAELLSAALRALAAEPVGQPA
jgi:AcrR family transcriptional regulator